MGARNFGRSRVQRTLRGILLAAALQNGSAFAQVSAHVLVQDRTGTPLAGVKIRVEAGAETLSSADGTAAVPCPPTGCTLDLSLSGYLPTRCVLESGEIAQGLTFQIVLNRTMQDEQNVTVHADASAPLLETESAQTTLEIEPIKSTPLRPATLIDTLPLVPGVSRTPDGRVIIEGSDESHSALLINSVNVTDPATGNFGLSVPVDSVEMVKVSISPFQAQYGSFISGVVSAETRRGGDKWTFSLNDPLPEFRIRSGHLQGLRSATPRVNFSGPLIANRLYFLEGAEVLMNKASVRTLPFPANQTRSDALNTFTQLDGVVNQSQTITASLHFAPRRLQYVNLNYFDPEPVTPNASFQEDTGSILHRWALGKGLLTTTFSGTRVAARVSPQASGTMTLTPVGNSGNYFGHGSREATRFQWLETWAPGPIDWHGKHFVGVGSVLANAEDSGRFSASTTLIRDASGHLIRSIDFKSPGAFDLADLESAFYVQDHWVTGRVAALDMGLRAEKQTLTHTSRFAPRAGFTLTPELGLKVVIRGGVGLFYDEVPLNMYAFASYPNQVVTTYDGEGKIIDGPRVYLNVTNKEPESELPFISRGQIGGNFAPYGVGWNVEAERTFGPQTTLRVRYLHNDLRDQLTLKPVTTAQSSALVLSSAAKGWLRQADVTAGFGRGETRQFFFSYARQIARGEQSDGSTYLGDFPAPVVRSPITAANPGEIPNRFLFWGTVALPRRIHVAPHLEWRNGFPFQPVDVLQSYHNFAPSPQPRFPAYFSADATVSKDINVDPKHAVRLSITGLNLTDHVNPLQVHNNIVDPLYGTFFGNYGRHLWLDFDVLF